MSDAKGAVPGGSPIEERAAKRLLMVSYNYPPVGAYGAVRTTKLARYLPSSGWLPTVLTVKRDRTKWGRGDPSEGILPDVDVIRATFPDVLTRVKVLLVKLGVVKPGGPGAESRLAWAGRGGASRSGGGQASYLQGLLRWAKRWIAFPDRYVLWFPFAVARGLRELRSRPYDAIYSTYPPITDHIVAAALHRLTGLPWLADFRDPWSQNSFLTFTGAQALVVPWLEKKLISGAGAIVTVSEPIAAGLRDLHGDRPAGVHSITNGYDPDDFAVPAEPPEIGGPLTLTYTGMFYGSKRDPYPVLEAVQELIDEGGITADEILIRLYGPDDPAISRHRGALRHPGILEICGVVPHPEAIRRQMESTALLNLMWDDPYSALMYGGKVFEYLGSRRPILAWNPAGGILADLLQKTGAGVSVATGAELKRLLLSWMEEFRRTGTLSYRASDEEVRRFAWDRLAGDMAGVLDRLVEQGPRSRVRCAGCPSEAASVQPS